MSLKFFFKTKKLLLLNIVLTLYVSTNLIGGERGLVSFFEKKGIEKNLVKKKQEISVKLAELDKKNRLLSDQVDLDYLDIIYRDKLKLGKKNEIVIKLR